MEELLSAQDRFWVCAHLFRLVAWRAHQAVDFTSDLHSKMFLGG